VNGFAQAAFGNFAKAFQLSNVLKLATSGATNSLPGSQDPLSILMAILFGIAIMTVTATVLLIMCIYFLVRIVLLWMLLIFSPIAFFVLALPDKMKKGVSAFANDWWSRLGSLLTGGPIVAFFLWLTLAVVQQSSSPFPQLYTAASPTESKALSPTITAASSPENITTMLVAVLMLMLGLKTAVDVSKQAEPALGGLAQSIRSGGGPVGLAGRLSLRAARATGRGTVAAGRVAGRGGMAGLRFADSRLDLSGQLGRRLQSEGASATRRGGVIGAVAGAALTRAGGRALTIGATERAGILKAQDERTKHLNTAGKLQDIDAQLAVAEAGGALGNKRLIDALGIKKAQLLKDGNGIKALSSNLEQQYIESRTPAGATPAQKKQIAQEAKAYAAALSKRHAGEALDAGIKSAEAIGDTDTADKLKDAQSKDPSLQNSFASQYRVAANKIDDYKQAFKDVKTEAWQDSGTFLAYMKAAGLVDESTGRMKDGYEEDEKWKELTSAKNGNRTRFATAHAKAMETDDGAARAKAQLDAMNDAAGPALVTNAQGARQHVSISSDGQSMMYTSATPQGTVQSVSNQVLNAPSQVADFSELTRSLPGAMATSMQQALTASGMTGTALQDFARKFSKSMSTEQAQHVTANATIYANPPAAGTAVPSQVQVALNGQTLGIQAPPQMQEDVLRMSLVQANSADIQKRVGSASAISNLNVNQMDSNPQVKEAVARALDGQVDELAKAYSASKNDPATMKRLEGVIQQVSKSAKEASAKAAAGGAALSQVEKQMAQIGEDIKKNNVLKKIGDRKKT